jgi:cell division protein FtsN
VEAPKVEAIPGAKPAAVSVANPPEKQVSVAPEKTEGKPVAPSPLVTKGESAAAAATPSGEVAPRSAPEKIAMAKASEAGKVPAPVVKTAEPTRPVESTAITPVSPVAKSETRPPQAQVPAPAVKSKVEEKVTSLPTREPAATEPVKPAQENKISESKTSEVTPRQAPVAKVPVQIPAPEQTKPAPAPSVAKVETQPMEVKPSPPAVTAKPKETVAAKSANEQVVLLRKPAEAISEKAPTAKATVHTPMPEQAKPAPPISVPKPQAPAIEVKPTPAAGAFKSKETVAGRPANEQVALLNKPSESTAEKKPLTHSAQKALEGFIIQLAFNDKEKARNWAESMERRGYAVSVTEAGTDGALRVRLGNFTVRDEAERQLRNFKQDGLNGIVINLPQAFRPEARSSVP